jgi:hypothetical protein
MDKNQDFPADPHKHTQVIFVISVFCDFREIKSSAMLNL